MTTSRLWDIYNISIRTFEQKITFWSGSIISNPIIKNCVWNIKYAFTRQVLVFTQFTGVWNFPRNFSWSNSRYIDPNQNSHSDDSVAVSISNCYWRKLNIVYEESKLKWNVHKAKQVLFGFSRNQKIMNWKVSNVHFDLTNSHRHESVHITSNVNTDFFS